MSFTFLPAEMSDDLRSLSRVGSPFFAPQTVLRIGRLETDLTNAVANAKAQRQAEFTWRTVPGQPIQIRASRQWKGGTNDFDPLSADINVDYVCKLDPHSDRVVANGVTVIRIRDGQDKEKVFHFDVEGGGWTEMHMGNERVRAGHPAFHLQFYGLVNDLPRVPTLIVHPVDVLSWAILELHQKKWRDHIQSASVKSQLRLVPTRQRNRMGTILMGWKQMIDNPAHLLSAVAMQSPISAPLTL